jgi:2-methylcitrate dehydratase PrpD
VNTGTMTKSSHSGHAARMGVESALLAEIGWTAHSDVFGPGGYFDTFLGGDAEPELLVEGFGVPYRMVDPGMALKKYPCNYYTHRPIDAALVIRERIAPGLEIDAVDIVFPDFPHVDRPRPETGLDGKFSVQFATVAALLDGTVTVDTFMDSEIERPEVQSLLGRTTMKLDPDIPVDFPDTWTDVSVRLSDGSVLTERMQKLTGFHTPLTRDQICGKFTSCAGRALGSARASELLDALQELKPDDQIGSVTSLLGAPRTEGQ